MKDKEKRADAGPEKEKPAEGARAQPEDAAGARRKERNLKKLSLGVAASVCARLLEKRFASVENAPEIVAFVAEKCLVLLKTHSPEGYPALRMAADITCRLIETKRLSNKEAAARNIRENLETLESVARTIPAEDRKDVLKPAVDMVLKLLETVTLSTTSVSPVIKKMAEKTKAFLDGGE